MSQLAERPPYRAALAVGAVVLAVYVLTLAPTVTFWDAGEFIAAARTLGIPHPPGTPLFVLIAHVWGLLVPVGEWAYRTNLLSALLSASAAGLFFLVVHQSMRGVVEGLPEDAGRWLRLAGAAAAAVLGAFTFTNWQNSNETEVYTVATFTTAAMSWAALLWRSRRNTERAPRFLLLIIYLAGISIGNHLLALLAVPGVLCFLVTTLWREPASDPAAAGAGETADRDLTGRELDVLRLLAEGRSTRDIAQRLSYSERTVKNIVHDVLEKLHGRTRAHAVALASRLGII